MLLSKQEALKFIKRSMKYVDEGRNLSPNDIQPGDEVGANLPVIIKDADGKIRTEIMSYKIDKHRRDLKRDPVKFYQNNTIGANPAFKIQAKACAMMFKVIWEALWENDEMNKKTFVPEAVIQMVLDDPRTQKIVDVGKSKAPKVETGNKAQNLSEADILDKHARQAVAAGRSEVVTVESVKKSPPKKLEVYKSTAVVFAKDLLTVLEKVDLRVRQPVIMPIIVDNPRKRGAGAEAMQLASDTVTLLNILQKVYPPELVYTSGVESVAGNGYTLDVDWSAKLFKYVVKEWKKIGVTKTRPTPGAYAEKIITEGVKVLGLRERGDGVVASAPVAATKNGKPLKKLNKFNYTIKFIGKSLGKNDPFGSSSGGSVEARGMEDAYKVVWKELKEKYPTISKTRYEVKVTWAD